MPVKRTLTARRYLRPVHTRPRPREHSRPYMQIPPGDASTTLVSGYLSRTSAAPRPVPETPVPPQDAAHTPVADRQASGGPNSPPPVERAHAVERIAHGTVPRDIPCGSLVDICA